MNNDYVVESFVPEHVDKVLSPYILDSEDAKKKRAFRILYKGKILKLSSGKSVWGQLGHAKTALKCHIKGNTWRARDARYDSEFAKKIYLDTLKHVEFVEYIII